MKRITIELPDDVAERLASEAQRLEIGESTLASSIVEQQLRNDVHAQREVPFAGIIDDPEFPHGADIEEWFATEWAGRRDRRR